MISAMLVQCNSNDAKLEVMAETKSKVIMAASDSNDPGLMEEVWHINSKQRSQ